jgi:hypothetical protein
MNCSRCAIIPNAHSFTHFGAVNGIELFYTSPARAHDYKETEETFNYYKMHINAAKNSKWIWIVDCEGMKMKHYSSIDIIKKLIQMLLDEHKGALQSIWIIHPNTWIKTAVALMKPFLKKDTLEKIQVINGEKLELYVALEQRGFKGTPLNWLTTTFSTPFLS